MEFCPEVAVFHSAFNLISKKAGKNFHHLRKADCKEYIAILHHSITEITQGLEFDLEHDEGQEWQTKMHGLVLYKLVKSAYISTPAEKNRERIPVCSTMDMLAELLPLFSKEFYFELIKTCDWVLMFLQSLQYLSTSVSQQLLQDLLSHCISDPVTFEDSKVITVVTSSLMSQLLSFPDEMDSQLRGMLSSLKEEVAYISLFDQSTEDVKPMVQNNALTPTSDSTTLDLLMAERNTAESVSSPHSPSFITSRRGGKDTRPLSHQHTTTGETEGPGPMSTVWKNVLEKESQILKILLDNFICVLQGCDSETQDNAHLTILAQTGLLTVLTISDCYTDLENWLTLNLFVKTLETKIENQSNNRCFCLNHGLANLLYRSDVRNEIFRCCKSALEKIDCDMIVKKVGHCSDYNSQLKDKQSDSALGSGHRSAGDRKDPSNNCCIGNGQTEVQQYSGSSRNTEINDMLHNGTELDSNRGQSSQRSVILQDIIVTGQLYIKSEVLIRMLAGCLNSTLDSGQSESSTDLVDLQQQCLQILRLFTRGETPSSMSPQSDLSLGEAWAQDLTLSATLWRIYHRLTGFTVCIDSLLAENCWHLWTEDRLVRALERCIDQLASRSRVQTLIAVCRHIESQRSEVMNQTSAVRQLMLKAFSEMSFTDQDTVVMETYTSCDDLSINHSSKELQITAVFNRLTSTREPEVLREVMKKALVSPREVIRTAVETSVKNEVQARNMAEILMMMRHLCLSHHEVGHPDVYLLTVEVGKVLGTSHLDKKEQDHFLLFFHCLLQSSSTSADRQCILEPIKLLEQFVFPAITTENMIHCNQPVSCEFALRLVMTTLDSTIDPSKSVPDWSEFEPVGLVLCLCWLLQECVVLWEIDGAVDGFKKISIKDLTVSCLHKITRELQKQCFTLQGGALDWLEAELPPLHWTVKVTALSVYTALGHTQLLEIWSEEIHSLLETATSQPDTLVPVLQFVGSSEEACSCIMGISYKTGSLAYETVVTSLIQVLPNLLVSQWETVIKFVCYLIDQSVVAIPFCPSHVTCLPLADFTGVKKALSISQILQEVMLTLNRISVTGESKAMLVHMSQCYVAIVRKLANRSSTTCPTELHLFLLSQLFSHVCDVTSCLPDSCSEQTFVLLLHMLNLYQDVKMSYRDIVHERLLQSCDRAVVLASKCLLVERIQTEMLLKKIIEVIN